MKGKSLHLVKRQTIPRCLTGTVVQQTSVIWSSLQFFVNTVLNYKTYIGIISLILLNLGVDISELTEGNPDFTSERLAKIIKGEFLEPLFFFSS